MNGEPFTTNEDDARQSANEDSLCAMARDFYNRKMLSIIIVVWAYSLVLIAAAIGSAIRFFKVEDTRSQIMYAAIFICCVQFMVLMKVFSWQMIHRNGIKRAISRLETRLARQNGTAA